MTVAERRGVKRGRTDAAPRPTRRHDTSRRAERVVLVAGACPCPVRAFVRARDARSAAGEQSTQERKMACSDQVRHALNRYACATRLRRRSSVRSPISNFWLFPNANINQQQRNDRAIVRPHRGIRCALISSRACSREPAHYFAVRITLIMISASSSHLLRLPPHSPGWLARGCTLPNSARAAMRPKLRYMHQTG